VTNNPVYHFFHTPGNLGPLVLRMTVAAIFFFHSAQKTLGWFGGPGWSGTLAAWSETLGMPTAVAAAIIIGEVLVCLSLFFGFLTRLAGLGVMIIMSGAFVVVARSAGGFADLELPLIVCASGFALFSFGAGALSVDRAISRNLLPLVG
jgi:putative oxidoreductase